MSVRRVGGGLAALAAAAGLWALLAPGSRPVDAPPNLLLVSIDTLRADHLGAYGHHLPTSPTIDRRLAADGVLFEEVYSQSPKTTPSHLTMLTSLHPTVHGVEIWDGTGRAEALHPDAVTLAEVLRDAGYTTAAFTGGAYMDGAFGFRQGFDVYEECDGAELGRARRWMKRHGDEPFFLFFHTYQVHDPYVPPIELIDRFAPGHRGRLRDVVVRLARHEVPWEQRAHAFWAAVDTDDPRDHDLVARLYDAGIRRMDTTTLAPLLDQLETLDLADSTLVVLTSDHGEAFGEHGRFLHDDLYEGTLRVPLILRFPGRLPAGRRVAGPVGVIDVMPTVLDLLDVEAPDTIQGRSLMPMLEGATPSAPLLVSDFSSRAHGRRYQSLRHGPLTYIVDDAHEELYDRRVDPGELRSVAAARPDDTARLRTALAEWRAASAPIAERLGARRDAQPGPETARQLRALGYLE